MEYSKLLPVENKRLKLCQKCHATYTVKRKHHIAFCKECNYPAYHVPKFYQTGKPMLSRHGNQKYKIVPYTKEEFKEWLKDYPQKRWL